jgi:ketosteroid isomerase-like protein
MNANAIRKILVPVLLVSGAAAGLLSAKATVAPDQAADAKQLTKLDEDWSKSAATKDAVKVAAFYAEDAIAYPPDEPLVSGRAAAQKVWTTYFAMPEFSISWKTTHAEVAASGDLGFTSGTYEDSFKGPDGKTVKEAGKYVCVWKKQKDGAWKAAHDIWNSDKK